MDRHRLIISLKFKRITALRSGLNERFNLMLHASFRNSNQFTAHAAGIIGILGSTSGHRPFAHAAKRIAHSSLALPVALYRQTPSFVIPKRLNDVYLHLVSRATKILLGHIAPPYITIRLKWNVIPWSSFKAIALQDVQILRTFAAPHGIPVWTDLLKRKSHSRSGLLCESNLARCWLERGLVQTFFSDVAREEVGTASILVPQYELFP